MRVRRNPVLLSGLVISLIALTVFPVPVHSQEFFPSTFTKTGPYVDELVFKQIHGDDDQVVALLNDELDVLEDTIDPTFHEQLDESTIVDTKDLLRNGYGYLCLNCRKYPLNETALRRAIAFAIDKEDITDGTCYGYGVPLDSLVPKCNPWSIEGKLDYSYYESDLEKGNQLLDEAGFLIDPQTGYRTAPDGSPFDILLEIPQSGCPPTDIARIVNTSMQGLSLDANFAFVDFYDYLNRLYFHGDYDMVFLGTGFSSFDIDWIAREYSSDAVYEPYFNFPNWSNATYDEWGDKLLHSIEYDEVYEAAMEMQKIWVYECPEIVLYENTYKVAYRNDRFMNIVLDAEKGFRSEWTPYKARLKNGEYGGSLRISMSTHPRINPFVSCSCYPSFSTEIPWDTLFVQDPDGKYIPWLAESYVVETNADNSDVPEGRTRFIFDIIDNALWSDGTPLTGEDIAWSFNLYIRDQYVSHFSTENICAAYSPENDTFIVEFEGESYWHLSTLKSLRILPKHYFLENDIESLYRWDPDPFEDYMVTSGPFNFTEHVQGEYYVMSYNPLYFYGPDRNATSTSLTNSPFNLDLNPISLSITSSGIIIMIGVVCLWKRNE